MPFDVILEKEEDETWGFQLTGGVAFDMPITVFEVDEGGHAEEAGIRLGDVLTTINDKDTDSMTLDEALDLVNSSTEVLSLTVNNLEDQEAADPELYAEDNFRVDVSTLDLKPPMPAPEPELAKKKCWHPIMLDTAPPPIIEEKTGTEEAPHKKMIRDFRENMRNRNRAMEASPEVNQDRRKFVERERKSREESELNMKRQLRNMQRQIAALSNLPAVLEKSLKMVTQRINRLLPEDATPEPEDVDLEFDGYYFEEPEEYESERYTDDQYEEEEDEYVRELSGDEYSSEVERTVETYSEEILSDVQEVSEPIEEENEEEIEEEEEEVEVETEQEYESEPEPEPTLEELERLEKQKKMEKLNRAWPWGDDAKPIYKISNKFQSHNTGIFTSRMQSLEKKMIFRNSLTIAEA